MVVCHSLSDFSGPWEVSFPNTDIWAGEFAVGDLVLVLNPLRLSKLKVVWEGPGKVIQKLGNVNYLVKMLNSGKKPVMYHVNSLKLYRDRSAMIFQCHAACIQPEHEPVDVLPELKMLIHGLTILFCQVLQMREKRFFKF